MTDLEQAIKNFRAADLRYDKPERYYRGDHDLAFATEKFENAFGNLFREFALNLCPAICDAVRDKLKISGFTVSDSGHTGGNTTVRECVSTLPNDAITRNESIPHPVHTIIEQIWDDNRLDLTAEEIHLEALKVGDSYAIVWPDENGEVTIYPQRAALCTVVYDDEMPGQMRWAAKYWRLTDDGRVRLNLIYPDRIEKYISRAKSELSLPDAREFHLVGDESGDAVNTSDLYRTSETGESSIVTNPFGVVPLFHFANTSEIGSFGRSELAQAIPIQNGLNKAVLDMLVAMEFSAFRQRWIAGIEIEYDEKGVPTPPFKSGMDRLWMSSNPQTTFGDFNTTDLDQFLKVKDSFRVDIASVTGTPLHYFLQSVRGFASGEALKRAEARFLAKVRDRQKAFGQTWSQLMSFALLVAGQGRGIRLRPQWEDPAPMAEREFLENLVLKQKLGLPDHQALLEAGYGKRDVSEMLRATVRKPARVRSPHGK